MTKEKLNYAQSFEKMKSTMNADDKIPETIELYFGFLDANKLVKGAKEDRYPEAFGILSMKVKKFLVSTTDLTLEDIDKRLSIL